MQAILLTAIIVNELCTRKTLQDIYEQCVEKKRCKRLFYGKIAMEFYDLCIKFVFLPIPGIICNIIFDPLIFGRVADDMFVKTGLPAKFQSQPVAMPGYCRFVRTCNPGFATWQMLCGICFEICQT